MFNQKSRIKNIALSSLFGVVEQFAVYILYFVYITVFLKVLTKEYLGITGLFTNVLQVFSLTELGIGSIIAYRLYKPIKNNDVETCHALIDFYRRVYRVLAVVVFLLGCIIFPFLDFIIADASEVPSDVNLIIVYWLFVFQSVTSYLFVYSQSLLSADQKNYLISFANTVYNIVSTVLKILILLLFKNYTYSLIAGIVSNVIFGFLFAGYIRHKYAEVFDGTKKLQKTQKKDIFKDTGSLMCHKIGYIVVNSTDSIILSKYIGLAVLGMYANYSMISVAIDTVLNKLLGSFVSSIGSLSLDGDSEKLQLIYNRLYFINNWLVSLCTICFFSLINPFITLWLDSSYTLGIGVVITISLNLFFNSTGIINSVFISSNGLFVKDKIRPLIQAIINLVVSVLLVKSIGLPGVFIGTLVSTILTAWFRQPIIVNKYIFKKSSRHYFFVFMEWLLITIIICLIYYCAFIRMDVSFGSFFIQIVVCFIITNLIFIILFKNNESFIYWKRIVIHFVHDRCLSVIGKKQ